MSYVANVIPQNRFEVVGNSLHFANSEEMLQRTDPNFDMVYKVQPDDLFQLMFPKCTKPLQTVGKRMIKFKGHNTMKQYTKKKKKN